MLHIYCLELLKCMSFVMHTMPFIGWDPDSFAANVRLYYAMSTYLNVIASNIKVVVLDNENAMNNCKSCINGEKTEQVGDFIYFGG